MIFDILSLSPGIFNGFTGYGIVHRALEKNIIKVRTYNIRDYALDKHKQVDDYPFGGGPGMVMKPEPLYRAITGVMETDESCPVIYFTPQGRVLNQEIINEYKKEKRLILLCGQFKEIDQRIRDMMVSDEISIGDFVLSGGEIPAMAFIDSLTRCLEGAIGDIQSALSDSHQNSLLGAPHYTRPSRFRGMDVPKVLLSGNHKEIDNWRHEQALRITKERRPDLYERFKSGSSS